MKVTKEELGYIDFQKNYTVDWSNTLISNMLNFVWFLVVAVSTILFVNYINTYPEPERLIALLVLLAIAFPAMLRGFGHELRIFYKRKGQ